MQERRFEGHWVSSRKDLLHFVEENTKINVYEEVGKDPKGWVDELNLIHQELTRSSLTGATGIRTPPIEDSNFRKLGEDVFLYRGDKEGLRGLWMKKSIENRLELGIPEAHEWTHYNLGSRAKLNINPGFSDIPIRKFLPENFERVGKPIKKEPAKRPIFIFEVQNKGETITVYAKGAYIEHSFYFSYSQPKYRLTPFASINKIASKREMEITFELEDLGVKTPKVVGYYDSPVEEFLFLERVKGKSPLEHLSSYREIIIKQDAEMLAALCLAGYRKLGFTDFDDKIFDGDYLHLIDVEECRDLYYPYKPNFRAILLNPGDVQELRKFRRFQRSVFEKMLKDAIFNYKETLTPRLENQVNYIEVFCKRIGWNKPTNKKIQELTTFPKDYQTFDSWICMMTEE